MKIGVLSDTHGRLESRVLEIFRGVRRILHAGDVGNDEVLTELSALAPVTAVLGNTDGFPLSQRLRPVEVLDLAGVRVLIVHDVGRPESPSEVAQRLIREHHPGLVVFGHTHAPYDRVVKGVRFFNPGGSGPRRFALPRTVALMEFTSTGLHTHFIELDPKTGATAEGREV